MAMRSRLPVLLALALVLCALPAVQAFAAAACAPCCAETGSPAPDSDCRLSESACCDLAPAAPVAPLERANPQPVPPAVASVPLALVPEPASARVPVKTRSLIATAPPARLSVVRLL